MSNQKKEYIEYYYFWLNQYKYRLLNQKEEEHKLKGKEVYDVIAKECKARNCCEFKEKMGKDFFAWTDCPNFENCSLKDIMLKADYFSIDDFEKKIGWKKDIFNPEDSYTDGCSLISDVIDSYNIYGEDERFPKDFGVNIIGGDDIEIDDNGNIKSNIILSINFDIPIEIILEQIRSIKNINLKESKTMKNLQESFCAYSTSIDVEYAIVKNLSTDEFNHKNTNSRLLGIAIWDIMHPFTYPPEEYPKTVKAAIESLNEQCPDYLEKMGYGNSELSVFRRLYNRTCECIERCEVLPMK